jgi:mRNA-degrading endonuclease RelE of RelBE toxin-antitoxin system
MDRLEKELRKLSRKELERVEAVLAQVEQGEVDSLQVKRLRGHACLYRVRIGRLRIIYTVDENGSIVLRAVRRRNDHTYRDVV